MGWEIQSIFFLFSAWYERERVELVGGIRTTLCSRLEDGRNEFVQVFVRGKMRTYIDDVISNCHRSWAVFLSVKSLLITVQA